MTIDNNGSPSVSNNGGESQALAAYLLAWEENYASAQQYIEGMENGINNDNSQINHDNSQINNDNSKINAKTEKTVRDTHVSHTKGGKTVIVYTYHQTMVNKYTPTQIKAFQADIAKCQGEIAALKSDIQARQGDIAARENESTTFENIFNALSALKNPNYSTVDQQDIQTITRSLSTVFQAIEQQFQTALRQSGNTDSGNGSNKTRLPEAPQNVPIAQPSQAPLAGAVAMPADSSLSLILSAIDQHVASLEVAPSQNSAFPRIASAVQSLAANSALDKGWAPVAASLIAVLQNNQLTNSEKETLVLAPFLFTPAVLSALAVSGPVESPVLSDAILLGLAQKQPASQEAAPVVTVTPALSSDKSEAPLFSVPLAVTPTPSRQSFVEQAVVEIAKALDLSSLQEAVPPAAQQAALSLGYTVDAPDYSKAVGESAVVIGQTVTQAVQMAVKSASAPVMEKPVLTAVPQLLDGSFTASLRQVADQTTERAIQIATPFGELAALGVPVPPAVISALASLAANPNFSLPAAIPLVIQNGTAPAPQTVSAVTPIAPAAPILAPVSRAEQDLEMVYQQSLSDTIGSNDAVLTFFSGVRGMLLIQIIGIMFGSTKAQLGLNDSPSANGTDQLGGPSATTTSPVMIQAVGEQSFAGLLHQFLEQTEKTDREEQGKEAEEAELGLDKNIQPLTELVV